MESHQKSATEWLQFYWDFVKSRWNTVARVWYITSNTCRWLWRAWLKKSPLLVFILPGRLQGKAELRRNSMFRFQMNVNQGSWCKCRFFYHKLVFHSSCLILNLALTCITNFQLPFGIEHVTLANLGISGKDTEIIHSWCLSIIKILIFFIRIQANERPSILHAITMLEVIVLSSHPEEVKNVISILLAENHSCRKSCYKY